MYYSGIDQHKRDSFITTYDSNGMVVKQARVRNSALLIQSYFVELPGPHKAVVESTGSWYWLADLLQKLGVELTLAHANRLKAISAAKVKTDKVDSDILAQLLRANLIPEAHKISPDRRGPRDLMRTRLRLISKSASCKNSIGRMLEKFNLDDIAGLDQLYQLQARAFEEQIALLDQQVHIVECTLHPLLIPNEDIQRLLWIPGIGKVNAFTIYTEIDDIERFPTVKQFLSYCRLVPGADNSAGKSRHRSGSKAGNVYLKLAFSHAGTRAIQYYPEIKAFYKAKVRRKPVRIARTLVSLEIARIVFQVLKNRKDFNGLFKNQQLSRTKQLQWPRLASPAV